MFIGGLNWETTDHSLHDYFSQFGEVQECTVMRDSATGRSRGFGFLTFKDPKTVNTVMVKEHFLDGKIVRPTHFDESPDEQQKLGTLSRWKMESRQIRDLRDGAQIDPKRAIPRDEQEKTAKIFVGGVSQDATEEDFEGFFAQFGRVVDATLMMDKDTGRPRGFGFVTFDSDAAVEKCLEYHPLEILGKPIEVKRAQPRGKMGEEDDLSRGRGRGKFGRDDRFGNDGGQAAQTGSNQTPNMMGGSSGMTPQMMAQYWQRMQQYFAMMQQQMAASMMGNMGNMGNMAGMGNMAMGQMNPQLMAQMQMQQQMQKMQGGNSPNPQSPNNMGNMPGMNPQMMHNIMQMQQGGMSGMNMGGARPPMGPSNMGGGRPGFSAQEQLAFEQQKYEHQQARRQGNFPQGLRGQGFQNQNLGGPQSWEGMYDDVPQPEGNAGGRASAGPVRNITPKPPKGPSAATQPSAAPANAPTGPKNAGKPGANFRGGRGRYHPYGR
ncbi:uncharacterized protein Z518_07482 [Rhinocladiella mackenziei CBS 650.93]|uniref:RRM domain-containing protein n=1 Tax=Rhinocladiella mackenziei CBS 650.93 TaxID=1442369 RepID=A0A0D2IDP1_9EURO|nr:uncharacterized protein Z518_07482 [Rhinocladiella mackenziei CBS 650.93]KIX03929.1 hypothetical protein Z518_07482 [Rhinocladiella mackenziei CBS 650.93]